jgi:phosphatidylserine/phosphatidylglycerophosphate/cardiolipin synthase-like enzyme
MKIKILFALLIALFLLSGCSEVNLNEYNLNKEVSEPKIKEYKIPPKVFFCPEDDCEKEILKALDKAEKSIHCAFYDIDVEIIIGLLDEKNKIIDVKLVVDGDNFNFVEHLDFSRNANSSSLMHNKFCIIDNKTILTGSLNPTENGVKKNNNNLIIIDSYYLSKNYEDEFKELWNHTYGKGNKAKFNEVYINNKRIENYFCPEDNCAYHVEQEIKKANQSIYFMTFSFTHPSIATEIVLKHCKGIEVKGIIEARQASKYSKFKLLDYQEIKIIKDNNKANMHHKVFIIDNKTVITGSFNPTKNADNRNDENILIIEDRMIAKEFLDEFEKLYN